MKKKKINISALIYLIAILCSFVTFLGDGCVNAEAFKIGVLAFTWLAFDFLIEIKKRLDNDTTSNNNNDSNCSGPMPN